MEVVDMRSLEVVDNWEDIDLEVKEKEVDSLT